MASRLLHSLFIDWTEGRRSPGLLCFGACAKPLSWLYHLGSQLDRQLRRLPPAAIPSTTRLIVVSSPIVGGVGKSPLVAHLASALSTREINVHLVTKGYKRKRNSAVTVSPGSATTSVLDAGDETVMLSRMTEVPVHVGGRLVEVVDRVARESNPDVIIVDDGVRQRWHEEKRIAVFASDDFERPVHYLPDGRWRVNPRRFWPVAGVAIMQVDPSGPGLAPTSVCERHKETLASWDYRGPIAWYRTVADALVKLSDGQSIAIQSPPQGKTLAFCGIGSPSRFARQVSLCGINPAAWQRFPDHHTYSPADVTDLENRCRKAGADWMLTTHKDAVKIDPAWPVAIPVYWLRIRLELTAGIDMLSVVLGQTL
jgi:tetraacyldisaccharide 4'-kinase